MILKPNKTIRTFGGLSSYFTHFSKTTDSKMNFSVYCGTKKPKNAVIWLSGLTCTEDNFMTKSGVQKLLKDSETMVICPDTSPRGLNLPGEHDDYDFGSGAGFYINATSDQYSDHYQMYDYIKNDIVDILAKLFNITNISIMGHSMGGHGALILGLREPNLFKSISAFAPIVNPLLCPWGEKAFEGYLGADKAMLAPSYDATELLKSGSKHPQSILIDQGMDDEFLDSQLLTQNFLDACDKQNQAYTINFREGYDHSYFFISSFLENHIEHHIGCLNNNL
jgi:S-formylglutathione hydrolase